MVENPMIIRTFDVLETDCLYAWCCTYIMIIGKFWFLLLHMIRIYSALQISFFKVKNEGNKKGRKKEIDR